LEFKSVAAKSDMLAAVYGGLYMLRRGMDRVVYDDAGVAVGVEAEGVVAKAKVVIGDPTYFPELVRTWT
jgi:Rab GDP dissociation inhibitor